ncbi:MAG: cytochrome ubiquinol oxidase subunit I [Proteobacteria bacterium]|nr:cytochrome ubiquinol oxidase subunit I [Pseudomonadota bacterium]
MIATHGLWFLLMGDLSVKALPFYSAIAATGASVVVLGALVTFGLITWRGKWAYLWTEWFTSLDHKRIGIMYVVLALVMLCRGLIEGVMMRLQQADAVNQPGFLPPEHFAQLFSTHGTIMIFFVGMPFLTGLINFVVPLQIGARDVSFPLLNSISFWLTTAGAALMMVSLVLGKFSTGGWSGYPPYTGIEFNPGVGPDYWIWAVSLGSVASTLSGLNFATTIYKERARGMTLFRMPLFTWTALCTSILMVFAMPPLTVATALLALDRYLGMHFFSNGMGGDMMNYPNLFWLFGHPEVYILVLPSFGVYSEVIATFSAKRLYGYTSLVLATMAIAVLSFTVWVHHFFTMGQDANINAAFGIATMLIGIPTGVKIYDWLFTIYRGRVRLSVPMLYSLGFIVTFVIGGLTGIILATPPLDYVVHNTVFLVAHFHNMLIPGMLFGLLAGYTYWFPKAFGFRLNEYWGRISFACWFTGFLLAFMPLYVLGVQGMPRRSQELFQPSFLPWLLVAAFGALVLLAAMVSLGVQLWVSVGQREANRVTVGDPWDGRALEWSIAAPPPVYNYAVLPQIVDRDLFAGMKDRGQAYPNPRACDYTPITMPKASATGVVIGLSGAVAAFALVWHIWWLLGAGMLVIISTVIARSFVCETDFTIPADVVAAQHAKWLELVRCTQAVTRDEEDRPANRGLAGADL